MTIVITTCTNRKRKPVTASLYAASLETGSLADVAEEWGGRLQQPAPRFPVMDVYAGRSFQEARTVAKRINAEMFVVSAGLGLVDASRDIPSYACTVADGVHDAIAPKVLGEFSSIEWWASLKRVSPFANDLISVAANGDHKLIVAALSDSYIRMLCADLLALADDDLAKLRLFTRAPIEQIPARLRPCVMPYDDRLDGPASPIKGTRSDFAGRALRHFADYILPGAEDELAEQHSYAVRNAMEGWPFPSMVERQRLTDDQILALLRQHWTATKGSTSVLLRVFRDQLNVACEQGRFASLARQVRAEHA